MSSPSRAIAAFLKAVAGLPKADLQKLSADLNDSIPEHLLRDQFNSDPATLAAETPIGSPQSASGNGASAMTREFSDPAPQSPISQTVAEFGQRLDRMEALQKTQTAVLSSIFAGLRALAKNEPFPSDAGGFNGQGDLKTEDEDEDAKRAREAENEANSAAKGHLPVYDIRQAFEMIGARSRTGIAPPPSFALGKAAASGSLETDILDDSTVEPAHLMQYRNYQSTLRAAAQGAATPEMVKSAYGRLPISVLRHLEAA